MPDETDYHGWTKPDIGADDWADDYYEFLDTIDARAFRYGPLSDRPNSAPDGAVWYDTDNEVKYQYDANTSDWTARGTHWQDYELVFDDETPVSDKYIRFVHED